MWIPSWCKVHHDAKSITMRIPSWCVVHLDVNPILMWISSWCEFPYDVNLIMKWISIWNKSKNDNEMNPKTPEKYSEFLIDWNVIKIETRIGILIIGKKGLFSRSCTESYFQSCWLFILATFPSFEKRHFQNENQWRSSGDIVSYKEWSAWYIYSVFISFVIEMEDIDLLE